MIIKIVFIIVSYLIGSIPFGWLFGKAKGIDIREHGSRNIGATNTGRVLGRKYAIYAWILDTLKGALIVFLFRFKIISDEYCLLNPCIYGLAAILGHTFPIYLHFKGGKAVATSGGMILGYCPLLFLSAVIVFFLTTLLSKFVSLGSLVVTAFVFIGTIVITLIWGKFNFDSNIVYNLYFPICTLIAGTIIYIRHISNIERLFANKESTIELIKKKR